MYIQLHILKKLKLIFKFTNIIFFIVLYCKTGQREKLSTKLLSSFNCYGNFKNT
jgi:hypothetical protein